MGEQDGTDYLVMECIDGETLAKRLEKGPLPLEQVLKYAEQIADALDRAHRSGVIHRDLKPGNIMLTKSGVKLLDFGLARPIAEAFPQWSTLSPFAGPRRAADRRRRNPGNNPVHVSGAVGRQRRPTRAATCSHLAAVLYEMATGMPAFRGKSQASVIAAIMDREPPLISASQPLSRRSSGCAGEDVRGRKIRTIDGSRFTT